MCVCVCVCARARVLYVSNTSPWLRADLILLHHFDFDAPRRYNLVRRLVITSFIMVLPIQDPTLSILAVFVLSLLHMIYVREALPHANDTTSLYVYGVNWQLLAFILVLLIVSATENGGSSLGLTLMSILLMLSNIGAVPLAFTGRAKDRERESFLRRPGSMRESEPSRPRMRNGKNMRGSACKRRVRPENRGSHSAT